MVEIYLPILIQKTQKVQEKIIDGFGSDQETKANDRKGSKSDQMTRRHSGKGVILDRQGKEGKRRCLEIPIFARNQWKCRSKRQPSLFPGEWGRRSWEGDENVSTRFGETR